jgi:hypothetical protein
MNQRKPLLGRIAGLAGLVLMFLTVVVVSSWVYATAVLRSAEKEGIYDSAEDGMRARIARGYVNPDDSQIIYAGTNSFDGSNPHIWYVIACVWGGHRLDGSVPGTGGRHVYDQPGNFFLETKKGWVFISEGTFPEYLGFWMKVFDLAGPGSPVPSTDWGTYPDKGCEF